MRKKYIPASIAILFLVIISALLLFPSAQSSSSPVQHVILIMMENKDFSQIIGNSSAPYINSLAANYALANDYYANFHPSLPNYLGITGGSNFGITTDCNPSLSCSTSDSSIFELLTSHGLSWKVYAESMLSNCDLKNYGSYDVHHNPALYYTSIRKQCDEYDVPMGTFGSGNLHNDVKGGHLPNFAMIIPNMCYDMHSCSISTGDKFLSDLIPLLQSSVEYSTTVIIITWDEGPKTDMVNGGGHVPTIIIGPTALIKGEQSSYRFFDHYSTLATIEDIFGIGNLGRGDMSANAMTNMISGLSTTATTSTTTTTTTMDTTTTGSSTSGTSVSISCSSNPATLGSNTNCTAMVTGNSPTGMVTFSSNDTGSSFSPSNQCTLSSGKCGVTYLPSVAGTSNITASYLGDANNSPSSDSFELAVIVASTTTSSSDSISSSTTTASSTSSFSSTTTSPSQTFGIDSSAKNQASSATRLSLSLSTTKSPDLIIVFAVSASRGVTMSISDSASLTWHARKSYVSSFGTLYEFYSVASNPLSSDMIAVTQTRSDSLRIIGFGIVGANTTYPFDFDFGLPTVATGSGTTPSVAVSTSNANDMILGFFASSGKPTIKQSSGFALISSCACSPSEAADYEIIATTKGKLDVQYALGASEAWTMIGDAIVEGSSGSSSTVSNSVVYPGFVSSIITFLAGIILMLSSVTHHYEFFRKKFHGK